MTTRTRCLLTFALLNLAFASTAQQSLPNDPDWSRPGEPFRIAGDLYYVGTYDLGCYLITSPGGHVLINSGLAASVPMIIRNVEALGFSFADIKTLLTTQAHFDHVAGLAEIKRLTGARMMVHEADAAVLADGGKSDFVFGDYGQSFAPVQADKLLHDGDTLHVGQNVITVLFHPGHTKGSCSYRVDTRDDTRAWTILVANLPTLLPKTRVWGMPSYPTVGSDYEYTFQALQKVSFDLWVASHASQFGLHEKWKPGYHPEVFGDRSSFDKAVSDLRREYDERKAREQTKR